MRPEVAAPAENRALVWKVNAVGVSAEISPGVLAALRAELLRPGADGLTEFGGILFGRYEGSEEEGCHTVVDSFEPFTIEHRYGATFSLSLRDNKRLRQKIEKLEGNKRRAVGLYRSHVRRGLYLDQRDFDVFQNEFRNPAALFLLIRRDENDGARGGIFVWEGDDIRRHETYQEFAIPAVIPAAPSAVAVRAPSRQPRPESEPRPQSAAASEAVKAEAPSNAGHVEGPRPSPWSLVIPRLPFQLPRIPRLRLRVRVPRLPLAGLPGFNARAALIVLGSIALPLGAFFIGRAVGLREHTEQQPASEGAATVRRPVRHAHPRPAPQASHAPPAPAPETETAQSFVPPKPDEAPDTGAQADSAPAKTETPRNYRERAAAPAPRIFKIARAKAAPPPALPDPPDVTAHVTVPQPLRLGASKATDHEAPHVVAYIKPAPHSSIAQALHKLPVFRSRSRSTEGFIPANPLEHPMPSEGRPPQGETEKSVELAARIDRSGRVVNVKFVQGNDQLANTSANALLHWKFEPARQNGSPVESEMLVRFEFSNPR